MKKNLISLFFLFSFIHTSFATVVNPSMVKFIHDQTKITFFSMCKEKLSSATDAVCHCLADNTAAYLNDDELQKCDIKDSACIAKVVETAGLRAFSKDGIKECAKQANVVGSPQPANVK